MLTGEEIARFHRDGFVVVRGVFDAAEVAALRAATDKVIEEGVAGRGSGHHYHAVDGRRQYWRTDGVWDRHPAFRAATANPRLLAAVGQCLGHPFVPVNDTVVVKLPRAGAPVPWHQDAPYRDAQGRAETFGVPNFDCDVYLDDATLDNGCLHGLAAQHLVGHVELERFRDDELFDRPDAVPLQVGTGDVLFHAISAPHGSRANRSEHIRRVFYLHYMAREVLEALHPDWSAHKPGFSRRGLRQIRAMVEARSELGWTGLPGGPVELTDEGLVFTGRPGTPPWHWAELRARMEPDAVRAAKTLAAAPSADDG